MTLKPKVSGSGGSTKAKIVLPAWLWLRCIFLALPAIFFPRELGWHSLSTHSYFGWPWEALDVTTPGGYVAALGFSWPNFDLFPTQFFGDAMFGSSTAWLLWRARRWASRRADWLGALSQALLAAGYGVLLCSFLSGVVYVTWDNDVGMMQWRELLVAYQWGQRCLPVVYAVGFLIVGLLMFLDARTRPIKQCSYHLAVALCLAAGCLHGLVSHISSQLADMQESSGYIREQIKRGH